MLFKKYFYTDETYKKRTSGKMNISKIAGNKSRWERKRDLDIANGDYITKIEVVGTDKEYMVTKIHGYTEKGEFYIAKPVKDKNKKTTGRKKLRALSDKASGNVIDYELEIDQAALKDKSQNECFEKSSLFEILLIFSSLKKISEFNIDLSYKNRVMFALRLYSGLSQSVFSKTFKLNLKTVQSWERGVKNPKLENILVVMYLMKFSKEYIIDILIELIHMDTK